MVEASSLEFLTLVLFLIHSCRRSNKQLIVLPSPVEFKGIVNRVLTTVARLSPEAGRQETLNTAQVLTQQQATSGERTLCNNQYTCVHTPHLPVGSSTEFIAVASSLNISILSQMLQHFFQPLSA